MGQLWAARLEERDDVVLFYLAYGFLLEVWFISGLSVWFTLARLAVFRHLSSITPSLTS